jgi:putative tributyrin esterase
MRKITKANVFLWLIVAFGLSLNIFGQENPVLNKKPDAVEEKIPGNEVVTLRYNSKLLAREMPFRVIFPFSYKNQKESEKRYPVIYLLHGLGGHFDNWTDRTKIDLYAKNYDFIIVTPEGNNGWYTDSATVRDDKYESYIVQELIPEIDGRFRTIANRENRIIAGLSMGGYGALKFGLKYPDKFVLAGSFSGALGVAGWTTKGLAENNVRGLIADSVNSVFGVDDSPTRANNDIFKMVREMTPEKAKTLPMLYVDCGTEDLLVIRGNREFGNLLFEKKIPHEFRVLPGAHDWRFWDNSIREFLEVSQKMIK